MKEAAKAIQMNAAMAEMTLPEETVAGTKRVEDLLGRSTSVMLGVGVGLALRAGATAQDLHYWLDSVVASALRVDLPDQAGDN
jgi:hypothetical protein